ncbi:tail fiber domain-containing protein [Rhodococcus gannanensis]|uniref:Tail fiber domain-containing protein n=1 Tax=Rhodococcus gannanensis TaxID=1960308 RepID=A0ABW4PCD8_9NOCA
MTQSPTVPGRTEGREPSRHHPVEWVRSHLTRRRGVPAPDGVPEGANDVLERLATLPLSVWSYRFDDESVRHLGPMAQDFASTFGLGSSDRSIAQVDANGVCMASVQALYRRLVVVEGELERLRESSGPAESE